MPEGYREKWGLKPDYLMVAPNYAAQRSTRAKAAGLGRNSATGEERGQKAFFAMNAECHEF